MKRKRQLKAATNLTMSLRYFLPVLALAFFLLLPYAQIVTGQSITINDITVVGPVYGNGDGPNGTSSTPPINLLNPDNNTVEIIDGGTVGGNVYGGYLKTSGNAFITGNQVFIGNKGSGGSPPSSNGIFGGYAESTSGGSATADANSVIVSNSGVVTGFVNGGKAQSISGTATATGNTVSISYGGKVVADSSSTYGVFGGKAESTSGSATATGNKVTISNSGVVDGNNQSDVSIYGGYAESVSGSATATGNEVVVGNGANISSSGSEVVDVKGGNAQSTHGSATATGNKVTVSGDEIDGSVYGGRASTTGTGSATATGNQVTISGGQIGGNVFGGRVESTNGPATAEGNSVHVYRGTISGVVFGGYAETGNASGNTVTISGGTITGTNEVTAVTGNDQVFGGYAKAGGNADSNTVEISGGIHSGNIYGGFAHSSPSTPVSASNNTVIISGNSTVTGTIYGGYVNSSAGDLAINNRVIIRDNPNLVNATLNGAEAGSGQEFQGNTLSIETERMAQVGTIKNFENFSFVLPANAGDGYVALQSDNINFGGKINGTDSDSKITDISFKGGGTPLQPGDKVILFQKTNGADYQPGDLPNLAGSNGQRIPGRKGIALLYDFALQNDGTADVMSLRVNPQTKALSEGRVAGAAFLNQGGDLLAYQGIGAAKAAANAKLGLSSFAVTSGGWSRYNTGSHVDVSGVSLMAGMAIGGDTPIGRITGGGFFEGGWGNYDTYNSFDTQPSVNGGGDTSYVGGGAFGRLDLTDTGPGHFYGELSGRAGSQYTDFSSNDLRDPGEPDRKARFNMEGAYYGLHTGLGYVWDITDAASLDLSGKYFWTHQEGGSVRIINDRFTFDDVDSHRARAGGRASVAVNEHFKPYIGAAYEYEFSGEAKAKTYERSVDAPDLTGSTGIGEIGVTLLGGDKAPISLDLGAQGYTGMRQGVTGSLQLKLEF